MLLRALLARPRDTGSVVMWKSVLSALFILASTCATAAGGPDVTINQAAAQADPTSMSPIEFTVDCEFLS